MPLTEICCRVLDQLAGVTRQLEANDFVRPCPALNESTVGQHLRHTLEFFLCLERGLQKGLVNYDQRDHDEVIQSDRDLALNVIDRIGSFLRNHRTNPPLHLQVCYDRSGETWHTVESNYHRELIYNVEHAVHHMALMKIGLREVAPYVKVPDDFGVAVSTLRHLQSSEAVR